jgi:hypothetical protein
MEREPLMKRLVLGLWRRRRLNQRLKATLEVVMTTDGKARTGLGDLAALAERFLGQLPTEVVDDLLLAKADEPAFLGVLKHYAASAQVRLSTAGARQLADMFAANRDAWVALMEYLRTGAKAERFGETILKEAQIESLERDLRVAQLQADIREASGRGISTPVPKPKPPVEQILEFLEDKRQTVAEDLKTGPVVERKIEEILAEMTAGGASPGDVQAERRNLQDAVFEFQRDLNRKRAEEARRK